MNEARKHVTCGGRVFVSATKDKKRTKILRGPEGERIELKIVGDQREYHEDIITQDGTVVAVPERIPSKRPVEIKPGDHVYTHHFLTHDDNSTLIEYEGEPVYMLSYDQIYAVVEDGQITKVLGQWVLAKPVEEKSEPTASGIYTKAVTGEEQNYAIITHMSEQAKEELDMKVGDKVYCHKRATYKIEIEGEIYYRMRILDIWAVIEEEELCQETV